MKAAPPPGRSLVARSYLCSRLAARTLNRDASPAPPTQAFSQSRQKLSPRETGRMKDRREPGSKRHAPKPPLQPQCALRHGHLLWPAPPFALPLPLAGRAAAFGQHWLLFSLSRWRERVGVRVVGSARAGLGASWTAARGPARSRQRKGIPRPCAIALPLVERGGVKVVVSARAGAGRLAPPPRPALPRRGAQMGPAHAGIHGPAIKLYPKSCTRGFGVGLYVRRIGETARLDKALKPSGAVRELGVSFAFQGV